METPEYFPNPSFIFTTIILTVRSCFESEPKGSGPTARPEGLVSVPTESVGIGIDFDVFDFCFPIARSRRQR